LLRRGIIEAKAVVDSDVLVRDISRRNCVFTLERDNGPSYILKQGIGSLGVPAIAHEAAVLRYLCDAVPDVRRIIPRFHDYDAENHILTVEFIPNARDLRAYHMRRGRFPTSLAGACGQALGALHTYNIGERPALTSLPPPWVLSIHRPNTSVFRDTSEASLELVRIVQRYPDLCTKLDELRAGWRHEAVIHGDVKSDNILVFVADRSRGTAGVKIVDWESAGPGDPCWDIASLLSSYVSFWLLSIGIPKNPTAETLPGLARYPLTQMQPALRSLWSAYAKRRGFNRKRSVESVVRTVEYMAARLIQTAFESAQTSSDLTGTNVLHLQLSLNILERPHDAAMDLLNLL
jgi:aminoglycoside phosphotransferase (APT) family kinase protein